MNVSVDANGECVCLCARARVRVSELACTHARDCVQWKLLWKTMHSRLIYSMLFARVRACEWVDNCM